MTLVTSAVEAMPDLSLSERYEISSPDESISHWVESDTTDPNTTTVTTETAYPYGMVPWHIRSGLDPTPLHKQYDSEQTELISLTTPGSYLHEFPTIQRFSSVLRALGYDWSRQTTTADAVTTARASFTYPSVDRINTGASKLLPDTPIKFVAFEGGKYTWEDYLASFAEAGEVIVPTKQPWPLHEHTMMHLLGMLAAGEDFISPARSTIKQWLVRNKAEAALPVIQQANTAKDLAEFLRPAQAVLDNAMSRFDVVSSEIGYSLLFENDSRYENGITDRSYQLAASIQRFWNEGKSSGNSTIVPSNTLGNVGNGEALELANTMWQRFETAEQNAAALNV